MIRNGQEVFGFLSVPINGDHALLGPQGKIADSVVPDSHLKTAWKEMSNAWAGRLCVTLRRSRSFRIFAPMMFLKLAILPSDFERPGAGC